MEQSGHEPAPIYDAGIIPAGSSLTYVIGTGFEGLKAASPLLCFGPVRCPPFTHHCCRWGAQAGGLLVAGAMLEVSRSTTGCCMHLYPCLPLVWRTRHRPGCPREDPAWKRGWKVGDLFQDSPRSFRSIFSAGSSHQTKIKLRLELRICSLENRLGMGPCRSRRPLPGAGFLGQEGLIACFAPASASLSHFPFFLPADTKWRRWKICPLHLSSWGNSSLWTWRGIKIETSRGYAFVPAWISMVLFGNRQPLLHNKNITKKKT